MYEAVHGREAPPDLTAAHNGDRADVGVWVHYWFDQVRSAIKSQDYDAFMARCVADVARKRKVRGIRNLGGLARKTIVPGVLSAMLNGGK